MLVSKLVSKLRCAEGASRLTLLSMFCGRSDAYYFVRGTHRPPIRRFSITMTVCAAFSEAREARHYERPRTADSKQIGW
jgi:hypothetical protein